MGVGVVQLLGEIEPAFAAQIDIYQGKIRAQLFDTPDGLSDRRRNPDNRDSAALSSLAATSMNTGLSSTITQRSSCTPDVITPVSPTTAWCHCG